LNRSEFFVVVPYYNEAAGIEATLRALVAQSDREFTLVLVDNASTDETNAVVTDFLHRHPDVTTHLISEREKGTGAASDTGFRFAIDRGATIIARTDADCIPDPGWVRNIKRAFAIEHLDFVIGDIKPRHDEGPVTLVDRIFIPVLFFIASSYGWLVHNGKEFKYRYKIVAGNNLAITAAMYLESGGFPRSRIEDLHEDRVLGDRVRMLTTRARVCRDVVVFNSLRRLRRYGYLKTFLWYWDHKYMPSEVDVR
jgi:glycosyltransferase involved in cell wall biosynthesis